jgi:hypothetical protein
MAVRGTTGTNTAAHLERTHGTAAIPARLQGPGVLVRTIRPGDNRTFPVPGVECQVRMLSKEEAVTV